MSQEPVGASLTAEEPMDTPIEQTLSALFQEDGTLEEDAQGTLYPPLFKL